MTDKSPPAILRILVLMMLAGALVCLVAGAWMMATDEGAPLAIFIAGAMLGALASVFAGRLKKK
jgi:hypothetical protein